MYGATQPGYLGCRLMGPTLPKKGALQTNSLLCSSGCRVAVVGALVGLGCLLGARLRLGFGLVRLRTSTNTHISSVRTHIRHTSLSHLVLLKVSPTHHPSFNTLVIIYYDTRGVVPRAYMIPKSHTWTSFTSECE